MTDQMTDSEVITWGDLAESLINNPAYIELYDRITMDLAKEMLASSMHEKEYRDDLFATYNGMRAFANRLVNMVEAKQTVLQRIDEENGIEPDFENE
ncbi:hypothetical protein GGR34_000741 [Microvirga flocculans]|uniref:Uncharacterized protein n=1 Tax=Microvirga flocculans TaxID=217168 RepID=A0A7W6N6Z3_9HYPH|nr:hypothetical protein [Microvirga flocculans]MBB4039106.1 hypothetical protein [Microvirga flocculans]